MVLFCFVMTGTVKKVAQVCYACYATSIPGGFQKIAE